MQHGLLALLLLCACSTPGAGRAALRASLGQAARAAAARSVAPVPAAASAPQAALAPQASLAMQPTPSPRRDTELPYATSDRPDEVSGYQVHFIYAIPQDGKDDLLDVNGVIELSANALNAWLEAQSGRRLRLDTYEGRLDVTFVQLPYLAAEISGTHLAVSDLIENWLKTQTGVQPTKLYVVFYDGVFATPEGFCGLAPLPPGGLGQTAFLLLRGYNPTVDVSCPRSFTRSADYTGFFETAILHEVLHLLGLVAECAPHVDGGHVTDNAQDLMYFRYDGSFSPLYMTLDYHQDDYFNHGLPNCPDLARSIFLEPLPAHAELPPRWGDSIRNVPPNPLEPK